MPAAAASYGKRGNGMKTTGNVADTAPNQIGGGGRTTDTSMLAT